MDRPAFSRSDRLTFLFSNIQHSRILPTTVAFHAFYRIDKTQRVGARMELFSKHYCCLGVHHAHGLCGMQVFLLHVMAVLINLVLVYSTTSKYVVCTIIQRWRRLSIVAKYVCLLAMPLFISLFSFSRHSSIR